MTKGFNGFSDSLVGIIGTNSSPSPESVGGVIDTRSSPSPELIVAESFSSPYYKRSLICLFKIMHKEVTASLISKILLKNQEKNSN